MQQPAISGTTPAVPARKAGHAHGPSWRDEHPIAVSVLVAAGFMACYAADRVVEGPVWHALCVFLTG